jgi:phosphoglycolate phosphatase-like HAD superfamily hydrolase
MRSLLNSPKNCSKMFFNPLHNFVVFVDSDGTMFDTMELKVKECFIPNMIKHFRLQAVSRYAREVAEFVWLYSRSRGINRFPAVLETLDWLRRRPEVRSRAFEVPVLPAFREWVRRETRLANPALEEQVRTTKDSDLVLALAWSRDVNQSVAETVISHTPFLQVPVCFERLYSYVDIVVASASPVESLLKELQDARLSKYLWAILGQENATKAQILSMAQHYPPGHTLMIGDAPGDYKAAEVNSCLFYPILAGDEERSWQEFSDQAIDRFLGGTFSAEYQQLLLDQFDRHLPDRPPWPVVNEPNTTQSQPQQKG